MGGLIVSALGLGAGYTLLTPKADVSDTANRLGALEAQARQTNDAVAAEANRESAAVAALEKRIGALESSAGASNTADLDKRVTALEAASAGSGAASDATQRLAAQAKDLRADVDAEKGEIPELSARSRSSNPTRQRRAPPAPISPPSLLELTRSKPRSPRPRMKPESPRRSSPRPTTPPRSPSSPRLRKNGCARAQASDTSSLPCNVWGSMPRRWRRSKPWSTGADQ